MLHGQIRKIYQGIFRQTAGAGGDRVLRVTKQLRVYSVTPGPEDEISPVVQADSETGYI